MKITRCCRTALRLLNLAVVTNASAEFVRMYTDELARLHRFESRALNVVPRTAFGAGGFSDS